MGKFGRHYRFTINDLRSKSSDQYIIPYDELRFLIKGSVDGEDFRKQWKECLKQANADFESRLAGVWSMVMNGIKDVGHFGALPEKALELYLQECGYDAASSLLTTFHELEENILINSEALRKLARKFDKQCGCSSPAAQSKCCEELIPLLYSSNLMLSSSALIAGANFLYELLDVDEQEREVGLSSIPSMEEEIVTKRAEELEWFLDNVSTLNPLDKQSLVAHRGFHEVSDSFERRPIENSLASFENAWASGINLCECDVALTKDDKIVMAHDDSFARLALRADSNCAIQRVSDLTLRQIFALPLKGGNRPPLLMDVLRSAIALSDDAKMIIEIKPGNTQMCDPLIDLFCKQPSLLQAVEAIMSYDAYVMSQISNKISSFFAVPDPVHPRASLVKRQSTSMLNAFNEKCVMQSLTFHETMAKPCFSPPKLMLVTMNQPDSDKYSVSVKDFSIVDTWMEKSNLDGIYLEYEKEMLEPEGIEAMKALARKYSVGVWMLANRDPDVLSVCRDLVEKCDVSYVNTDFPSDFFRS